MILQPARGAWRAPLRRALSSASSLVDAGSAPPIVPPGQCAFGEEFAPVPLLARVQVNHDSQLLTFGLPDGKETLGLSTCACILAQSGDTVRPYTPISTNADRGSFDLLVKCYELGELSKVLGEMPIGDTSVSFKHIEVKNTFFVLTICFLCFQMHFKSCFV